jgi:hypothetical protein
VQHQLVHSRGETASADTTRNHLEAPFKWIIAKLRSGLYPPGVQEVTSMESEKCNSSLLEFTLRVRPGKSFLES